MKTKQPENKDYMLRVRMTSADKKKLKKIAKILKASDSETIRVLIDKKINELDKQKNIFE